MRNHYRTVVLVPLCAAVWTTAAAAPVVTSGYDGLANKIVDPTKAPATARAVFETSLGAIGSLLTENFEGMTVPAGIPPTPTPDVSFSFGKIAGNSIFPSNETLSQPSTGVFNTTSGGSKFIDSTGNVMISFTQAVSGFGLYVTDLGDFANSEITATLVRSDGTVLQPLSVKLGGDNAGLLFWGFLDSDTSQHYSSITFNNNSLNDVFAMDDFVAVIGAPTGAVPEPSTYALMLAGLGLLGFMAKRRKQ